MNLARNGRSERNAVYLQRCTRPAFAALLFAAGCMKSPTKPIEVTVSRTAERASADPSATPSPVPKPSTILQSPSFEPTAVATPVGSPAVLTSTDPLTPTIALIAPQAAPACLADASPVLVGADARVLCSFTDSSLPGGTATQLIGETLAGSCPSLDSNGGTGVFLFPVAGECAWRARACLSAAPSLCGPWSAAVSIHGFSLSLSSLTRPVSVSPYAGGQCLAAFTGTLAASANVSARTLLGSSTVPNSSVSAFAGGMNLAFPSSTAAGSYGATWTITNATLSAGGIHSFAPALSGANTFTVSRTAKGPVPLIETLSSQPTFGAGHQFDQSSPVSGCVDCQGQPSRLAAGNDFMCALKADGNVACWGANGNGQLGQGNSDENESRALQVAGISNAVDLSAARTAACVVVQNGATREVKCWGRLISPGSPVVSTPTVVYAGTDVAGVFVNGDLNPLILRSNGTLLCLKGINLCDNVPGTDESATLRSLSSPINVRSVVGVSGSVCALTGSGTPTGEVWCWGSNWRGELGRGNTGGGDFVPARVGGGTLLSGVVALGAAPGLYNWGAYCASLPSQSGTHLETRCWGTNKSGALGVPSAAEGVASTPILVDSSEARGLVRFTSSGLDSICGLRLDGQVVCWGSLTSLKISASEARNGLGIAPRTVFTGSSFAGKDFVAWATGEWQQCAILAGGVLSCGNGEGACTLMAPSAAPTGTCDGVTPINATPVSLASTVDASCYASTTGAVYCSSPSDSASGVAIEMGKSTAGRSRSPRRVSLGDDGSTWLSNVVQIAPFSQFAYYARRSDGTLYRWGSFFGTLLLPEAVPGASTPGDPPVIHVDGGRNMASFVCAVVNEGSANGVRCWGLGNQCQVGVCDTTLRDYPAAQVVAVPTTGINGMPSRVSHLGASTHAPCATMERSTAGAATAMVNWAPASRQSRAQPPLRWASATLFRLKPSTNRLAR